MTRSEPVLTVGAEVLEQLGAYAKEELEQAGDYFDQLVAKSDRVHVIFNDELPIAVAGVVRRSLLGPAFFWFQLADKMHPGHLKALRRALPELFAYYPRVETGVEVGWRDGERFAKFFGFRPFGEPYGAFGRWYQQYEARG